MERSLNITTFSCAQTMVFLNPLEEWFSRWPSRTTNIDIIWEVLRNANSEAPSQTSWESEALGEGPVMCDLTSRSGDSNVHCSLRTTISITSLILCPILPPTPRYHYTELLENILHLAHWSLNLVQIGN